MIRTLKLAKVVTVLLSACGSCVTLGQEPPPRSGSNAASPPLFNAYERLKNGPPLTNVFHKIRNPSWFLVKIGDPKNHPAARMPDLKLEEEEVIDIIAYLKSIAAPDLLAREWPAWANKGFEEMNDDEIDAMLELADRGQVVWSNARCSVCHAVNGPSGERIGGFVDLRVGGIDLMGAGPKLQRNWFYQWIEDPKLYFPDTMMPRFRFSENEIEALVEYVLRDDAFRPVEEPEAEDPNRWNMLDDPERVARGRKLIELARCVVCHDIEGISEVLTPPEPQPTPPTGDFESLAYDLRCLSCHAIEQRGGTYAPDLTGEGSRLKEEWIAQFVESPDMVRPLSQQMPKFNLTADEAKIIASYLSTSRRDARIPQDIPGGTVSAEEIERGREIFQTKGCLSCHTTGEGVGGVVGPDLTFVADRMIPGAIWFHITSPHAINPYTAEPDYGLSEDEARGLAAYMTTRKK